MARVPTVVLTDAKPSVEINVPEDQNGVAGFQYHSGTGTIVLEVTADRAKTWVAITMWRPTANPPDYVASLAVAGYVWAEITGADSVRARKTSAGAGTDTTITFFFNPG